MTTQKQNWSAGSTAPSITVAERERRARSIHSIRRSQQIEGGDISPFAVEIFAQYVEGKITLDEVGAALGKHYGVTVK